MKYLKLFEFFEEDKHIPIGWLWEKDRDKTNLDMTNFNSVLNFVHFHADPHLYKDGSLDRETRYSTDGTNIDDRIKLYMEEYNSVMKNEYVLLYRVINMDDFSELKLNEIGPFWSFKKECAKSYGTSKYDSTPYLLTGKILTKDIDWKSGLLNFMTFSVEQYECFVKKGSTVSIVEINNKKIKPIAGII